MTPANVEHPSDVPTAPVTEHGETSGLKPLVDDLHERRAKIKLGGGVEKISAQHEKGKLTARERVDLLVDPGHLRRDRHARPPALLPALDGGTGRAGRRRDHRLGRSWSRPSRCAIVAYDFTVMAGSMGMTGEIKVARLREMALQKRMPFIWLLDSAGAQIQEAVGSLFAGSGHLFREEVIMSGCHSARGGHARALRRGHGLHPGARRLRPDGRPDRGRWPSPARIS